MIELKMQDLKKNPIIVDNIINMHDRVGEEATGAVSSTG